MSDGWPEGGSLRIDGEIDVERKERKLPAVRAIALLGLMGSIFIASDSPMVHPGQKVRAF